MIYIEDYMNSHSNWREEFAAAPYFITVKEEHPYILLQYSQLESDFSNPMVQQARGSIFRWSEDNEEWVCVCRPFRKFHNIQEEYAAPIDWTTAHISEKVDGSLMKLWCDCGNWHLSTNGCIDAFKADARDSGLSFGEVFLRAAGIRSLDALVSHLNPYYTYLFELTSPETRVVIEYEDGVYFLAARYTDRDYEVAVPLSDFPLTIKQPRSYAFSTPEEAIEAAAALPQTEEGYVVCDAYEHRVKIKSPAYLAAHRAWNNGNVSVRTLIEAVKDETIDDLLVLAPHYKKEVNHIKFFFDCYCDALRFAQLRWEGWIEEHPYASESEIIEFIKTHAHPDYMFRYYRYNMPAKHYIFNHLKTCTLVDLYKKFREKSKGLL